MTREKGAARAAPFSQPTNQPTNHHHQNFQVRRRHRTWPPGLPDRVTLEAISKAGAAARGVRPDGIYWRFVAGRIVMCVSIWSARRKV